MNENSINKEVIIYITELNQILIDKSQHLAIAHARKNIWKTDNKYKKKN